MKLEPSQRSNTKGFPIVDSSGQEGGNVSHYVAQPFLQSLFRELITTRKYIVFIHLLIGKPSGVTPRQPSPPGCLCPFAFLQAYIIAPINHHPSHISMFHFVSNFP